MASLKHRARLTLQRAGLDVLRFPQCDSMWRLSRLLESNGVDLVLDVGANDGGFAGAIRRHGYVDRIVSFEPLAAPFARLRHRAYGDSRWECLNIALGSTQSPIVMNIAGNNEASSSALAMTERHVAAAPDSAYVGTEVVQQSRLDDVIANSIRPADQARIHLKIDVQGYERAVLHGAGELLRSKTLVGLQLELSLTNLYEGGMLWQEGFDLAVGHGFEPMSIIPGFTDLSTGQTLQVDAVFFRPGSNAP